MHTTGIWHVCLFGLSLLLPVVCQLVGVEVENVFFVLLHLSLGYVEEHLCALGEEFWCTAGIECDEMCHHGVGGDVIEVACCQVLKFFPQSHL